ncbi:uncharacterized protein G2W53_006405 [Senna tora]|uniref:Uncharacterized protein n=1 Tax=Senna tora TaxID=362788 RepID=A0A834X3L0_9FABA|nr:uncharacterized protein G2W53_006405 [Senna tora]
MALIYRNVRGKGDKRRQATKGITVNTWMLEVFLKLSPKLGLQILVLADNGKTVVQLC